jgi:hypothetical protein
MGLSLVRNGLTGPILMLWVVLVTTVVTIIRFTITPTTAVVCFRWVPLRGRIVHTSFHSFANSACYYVRGGTHSWANLSS